MLRKRFVSAVLLVLSLAFCATAQAERPRVLGRAMVRVGDAFHGNYGGAENSYFDHGPRLGARLRARNAWTESDGHRFNLERGVGANFFRTRVVGGWFGRPVSVVGR